MESRFFVDATELFEQTKRPCNRRLDLLKSNTLPSIIPDGVCLLPAMRYLLLSEVWKDTVADLLRLEGVPVW